MLGAYSCDNSGNAMLTHCAPLTMKPIREVTMAACDSTKRCPTCEQQKPISEFNSKRGKPSGYCRECQRQYARLHYQRNKELYKSRIQQWRQENRDKYLVSSRNYYERNREKHAESSRAFCKNNPEKRKEIYTRWRKVNIEKARAIEQAYREKNRHACNDRIREWKKQNPFFRVAESASRLASELNATPAWANSTEITRIYKAAYEMRQSGLHVHVDHIVPLRSKLVCGLHCEANLRIIPAAENLKKSNLRWPDMP